MDIKMGRDVLYLEAGNLKTLKDDSRKAPRHIWITKQTKKLKNRGCPRSFLRKGVLTVEAAFCATAFFLVLFSLLYLFSLLAMQQNTELKLANASWKYSSYGIQTETLSGILGKGETIFWKEEKGICYVDQREPIPFLGGRFAAINRYQQMRINAYRGKSMVGEYAAGDGYVYVAENGTVYHCRESCVYLNPGIRQIYFGEAGEKRNRSGGKYKGCESCADGAALQDDSEVFITPYGDRYHVNKDCPGLKRTIRKLRLSEIGSLPPCSKCGGARD